MKIDERVEPLVREAFAAAIARDADRLTEAVTAIAAAGDQTATDAINLALKITAYALLDIHEGFTPDQEQIHDLAKDFCEMEEWAVPDEAAAVKLLTALGNVSSVEAVLRPEEIAVLLFVLGAWLLTAFLPDDKHWPQYLDEILDDLERNG
ncbi:MAG: hypothetical protein J2P15_21065 [Micromonosporaceae bacterium]|nr:hypothetical protein [Micromonosporaceae bacterium]